MGCVANLRNNDDGVMGDDRVPLQIDEEEDGMICSMARELPTLLLKRNICMIMMTMMSRSFNNYYSDAIYGKVK